MYAGARGPQSILRFAALGGVTVLCGATHVSAISMELPTVDNARVIAIQAGTTI